MTDPKNAPSSTQEARWLTKNQQRAWRQWINIQARSSTELTRQLQSESKLSLAEYVVLVHLSEAPERQLRIAALADALQWDRSRVSHQLTRMSKRGFVSRKSCDADGRGAFVVLEEEGLNTLVAAAPGHANKVQELFFDKLTDRETIQLANILEKLDAQFEGHLTTD